MDKARCRLYILKTAKKDQDITLAASDDTEVRLETIADTQGGAIGAASAKAENSLQRSNKLKVAGNSYLESTNDVTCMQVLTAAVSILRWIWKFWQMLIIKRHCRFILIPALKTQWSKVTRL